MRNQKKRACANRRESFGRTTSMTNSLLNNYQIISWYEIENSVTNQKRDKERLPLNDHQK